ncbi:MAG: response regulator transcription factor [Acidobacteria bacterium]|nr:response regulator transcription factor [Acidobacteriota bacterium]
MRNKEQIRTTILIADDHPVFRQGLKSVIDSSEFFEVIAEASTGEEAVDLVKKLLPDIVVLDVDMPVLDGISSARIITAMKNHPKICFLTLHNDMEIFNAMKLLKADGYILKDAAVEEITECLMKIANGETYISLKILRSLPKDISERSAATPSGSGLELLTPTELKIIKMVALGKTTRQIAGESFVSVRTIENHRSNICSKLDLRGNHSLLRYALANKHLLGQL